MAVRIRLIMVGFVGVAFMVGCGAEAGPEDQEPTDEAVGALLGDNAISLNAISLNAISLNAISLNALDARVLNPDNLAAIQDPGPKGTLARQFVRYAVGCAFTSSQRFSFSWTDGQGTVHDEVYPGQLGVAPSWATGPLDTAGQRIVSACVIARVNYYEVPVVISVRSQVDPLRTLVNSWELANYPDVEGAFWGNLFGSQPYANACYNPATVDNSRSWLRDCAVGHLTGNGSEVVQCGMIKIAGPCPNVCPALSGAGQYYPSCIEKPGQGTTTTQAVVTIGLP